MPIAVHLHSLLMYSEYPLSVKFQEYGPYVDNAVEALASIENGAMCGSEPKANLKDKIDSYIGIFNDSRDDGGALPY